MNSGSVALGKTRPTARRLWAPVRAAGRGGAGGEAPGCPTFSATRLPPPHRPWTALKGWSQAPQTPRTRTLHGGDADPSGGEWVGRAQQSCVVCRPTGRQSQRRRPPPTERPGQKPGRAGPCTHGRLGSPRLPGLGPAFPG